MLEYFISEVEAPLGASTFIDVQTLYVIMIKTDRIFEHLVLRSADYGLNAVRVRLKTLSPPVFGKEICQ